MSTRAPRVDTMLLSMLNSEMTVVLNHLWRHSARGRLQAMSNMMRLTKCGKSGWLLLACFFVTITARAQPDPEAIWTQLLKTNGKGDFPPELKVQDLGTRGPAIYSKGTVYLEACLPAALDSALGDQAESALSYVLAHELAHHNRDHICSHFIRRGIKGTETESLMKEADQRKAQSRLHESEADLLAGLYGHIAGYRPLDAADTTLAFIYRLYDLPDSIPGYPSLGERRTIADNARSQLDQVALAYDMAWITCALGMHDVSAHLSETILKAVKYNAPEIYELLATAMFLEALEFLAEEHPSLVLWGWPIRLNHETNARSTTRGASQEKWDVIKEYLTEAEKWAQRGSVLKPTEARDEGLLKSIQFMTQWSEAPENHLKAASKVKPTSDIESNLTALALWLDGKGKDTKKATQLLEKNGHPSSRLNLRLVETGPPKSDSIIEVQCNKLKAEQQEHLLFRPNSAKDRVMLGKTLVFSREKTDDGWDIQFGRGVLAPRILTWSAPFNTPFCWDFQAGTTTLDEVLAAFEGSAFRQLTLEQGSFIGFPVEKLAFQFGPNGTLTSISWKSL